MLLAMVILLAVTLACGGTGGGQPIVPYEPAPPSHRIERDWGPDPCPWEAGQFGPRMHDGECKYPS